MLKGRGLLNSATISPLTALPSKNISGAGEDADAKGLARILLFCYKGGRKHNKISLFRFCTVPGWMAMSPLLSHEDQLYRTLKNQ
jgi:hypothetical protein